MGKKEPKADNKEADKKAEPAKPTDDAEAEDSDNFDEQTGMRAPSAREEKSKKKATSLRNWKLMTALVALVAIIANGVASGRFSRFFGPTKLPPHLAKLGERAFDGARLKHTGGYSGSAC